MSDEWFKKQEEAMKKFPAKFLRPKNPISRTLSNLGSALSLSPEKAHLCKTHKVLNGQVIRAFFLQVTKECTTRIASYERYTDLPEDVAAWIKRLHSLNSYWMTLYFYCYTFQVSPDEPRYEPVEGGCEACILARIGGNVQAIYDLECSAFTRSLTQFRQNETWEKCRPSEEPRILKLLDGWMHERGLDSDKNPLYTKSLSLVELVGKVRYKILEERRAKRDAREKGINPPARQPSTIRSSSRYNRKPIHLIPEDYQFFENEEGGAKDEQEDVNTIIDYYANRMSVVGSDAQPPPAESMHPAYRYTPSVASSPGSTVDKKGKGPAPPASPVSDAYSSSVYSQPTNAGGAYGTQGPYFPPFRTPPKKPTRPAHGPPPAAAESFFKNQGPAMVASNDQGESEWEDDTVHTEVTTSSRLSKRDADRKAAADRTSEDRARAYRALVGNQSPSPSPPPTDNRLAPQDARRGRGRAPSIDRASQSTNWEDFYK